MAKLMDVLGKKSMPKDEPSDRDLEESEEDDDIAIDDDEMAAAKAVRAAKSDAEFGKALKAFIKICGDY